MDISFRYDWSKSRPRLLMTIIPQYPKYPEYLLASLFSNGAVVLTGASIETILCYGTPGAGQRRSQSHRSLWWLRWRREQKITFSFGILLAVSVLKSTKIRQKTYKKNYEIRIFVMIWTYLSGFWDFSFFSLALIWDI